MEPLGRYWVVVVMVALVATITGMVMVMTRGGNIRMVTGRNRPITGRVIITGTTTVAITRAGTTMAGMASPGTIRGVTVVIANTSG